MLGPLAHDVQGALEGGAILDFGTAREEGLADPRRRGPGGGSHGGKIHRHVAPAEERLALLTRDALEDDFALPRLAGIAGQEDEPGAVMARRGERETRLAAGALEELVRHLQQDSRPVAGVRLAAAGAAVEQVLHHRQRLLDDAVGAATLQVRDESHAAHVSSTPA